MIRADGVNTPSHFQEWIMKKLVLLLGVSVIAITIGACQTIQGAGRDIERAGEELEEVID